MLRERHAGAVIALVLGAVGVAEGADYGSGVVAGGECWVGGDEERKSYKGCGGCEEAHCGDVERDF